VVKDVVFVGSAGDDLRSFPPTARRRTGYQLYLVQAGSDPTDWKPMPSVGPGCREIRVRAEGDAYRAVYVASIGDAVYVLHCFEKKTRQTPKADIDLAKQRYRQVIESIRAKERP
jgi:phage-related protein